MKRDAYDLATGDVDWAIAPGTRSPAEHLDGLLQRLFGSGWHRKFPARAARAAACVELTRRLQQEFDDGATDPLALSVINCKDPSATVRRFRTFCLGFSMADLRLEESRARQEHRRLIRLVARHKRAHSTLAVRAARKGQRTRKFLHILAQHQLAQLEDAINVYFDDPRALATAALRHETLRRRINSLRTVIGVADTYDSRLSWFEYGIERLDPEMLTFPFRFFRSVPLSALRDLRKRWRDGATAAVLLPTLEKHVQWEKRFNDLELAVRQLGSVLPRVRQRAIAELRGAWHANAFLSATTLAVTQVEGVLWDVARYLNSTGPRIFKETARERYPYTWDFEKRQYQTRTAFGTPQIDKGKKLNSAHALLRYTRLGEFFPFDVHTFLMDEHYADRCYYAHGASSPRDIRADAVVALLCLSAVVDRVLEIVEAPDALA